MCLPEGEKERERAMALEAMLYANNKDLLFTNNNNNYNYDLFNNSLWGYGGSEQDFNLIIEKEQQDQQGSMTAFLDNQSEIFPNYQEWNNNNNNNNNCHLNNEEASAEPTNTTHQNLNLEAASTSNLAAARPKKRRAKSRKNKEEIENQRMTHIAVERNRRKQMNEYLSVLRSLMPDSYVQRGDQASIIGGAINYVKELEQRLQFFGAQKETQGGSDDASANNMPFSEFFAFPQYSSTSGGGESSKGERASSEVHQPPAGTGIADIEVTMVESHANLKIRAKKRPKQLLKMVSSLHAMRLPILHLNVTTTEDFALYSLSVKVEDDCKLGSVDEIAAAVYQMLDRIQQESMC